MLKRIISGIIGIPLLIFIILQGGLVLYLGTMVVSLIGLYEFYQAMIFKKLNPLKGIGYGLSIIILSMFYADMDGKIIILSIFSAILLLSGIQLYNSKYTILDNSITLYGCVYVTIFLGHILLTDKLHNSFIIWLIFIIAWATDTFAYFGGYFFGNKKLCPSVSPKKTVEGAIAGIMGSMICCGIFGYIFLIEDILLVILVGLIGSIISQLGDLTASQIKRYVGIKDFGNIIPGHGGVLDRFDSILFTAPTVYYFFVLFMQV
ncbi:phosphatidate cytidylyltransferase [Natronincola peptidivorans]|uniref:Phosphatidate cytidylyltransferase n=1 Tax=Natronincola peptidivorans TaxID=426128 RepID=A0A1H9YGV5_9FIRM|nr:phosphatidate cytidylyltransferase [Natronincola peptidivorans]SES68274.1 phosphatidate cytidylyltransferase [Natronincola peptidivorans]